MSSAGRVEVDRKADVAPGPFASTTRPQASGHPSQEDGTWWGVLCLLSALGLCGTLVVGRPEGDGTDTAQVDERRRAQLSHPVGQWVVWCLFRKPSKSPHVSTHPERCPLGFQAPTNPWLQPTLLQGGGEDWRLKKLEMEKSGSRDRHDTQIFGRIVGKMFGKIGRLHKTMQNAK